MTSSSLLKIPDRIAKLSEQEQTAAALDATRELLLNDFFLFAKRLLGYSDMEWDVHREAVQALESSAKRKLIVMPRGSFKSSLGSVAYPIWRILKDPNITILLDSELYTNSKNLLREIKGHLSSARFINIFTDISGSKWDEGEIIVKTRTRNRKEATITVGGIGTTKVGQHYDLIIGDDYNSAQNSDSPEKCQKVLDHFKYNLNILNPGGEYVIIGTRYAELDVIGFLLSNVLEEKYLAEGKLLRGSPHVQEADESGGIF
jgi:hypothetical protein